MTYGRMGSDMKKTMLTSISLVDAVNYVGGGDSTVWYDEFAPIGFFENGEKKNSPNHE